MLTCANEWHVPFALVYFISHNEKCYGNFLKLRGIPCCKKRQFCDTWKKERGRGKVTMERACLVAALEMCPEQNHWITSQIVQMMQTCCDSLRLEICEWKQLWAVLSSFEKWYLALKCQCVKPNEWAAKWRLLQDTVCQMCNSGWQEQLTGF